MMYSKCPVLLDASLYVVVDVSCDHRIRRHVNSCSCSRQRLPTNSYRYRDHSEPPGLVALGQRFFPFDDGRAGADSVHQYQTRSRVRRANRRGGFWGPPPSGRAAGLAETRLICDTVHQVTPRGPSVTGYAPCTSRLAQCSRQDEDMLSVEVVSATRNHSHDVQRIKNM